MQLERVPQTALITGHRGARLTGMLSAWLVITTLGASLVVGAQEPEPKPPLEIAGKELSELLEDWPNQYVRWIITDAEKKVYESLPTDGEKLQFIEFSGRVAIPIRKRSTTSTGPSIWNATPSSPTT